VSAIPPGWYKDPAEPTTQRYWDGGEWIGAPLPADATPPDGPPPNEPSSPTVASADPDGVPGADAGPPPPDHRPGGGQPGHQPAGPPSGPPPPGWRHYHLPPPEPRPHGLALAPLGARLVARFIDIGIVLLLNIVINGWFVWQYVQEMWPTFAEIWRRSLAGDRSTEGLPMAGDRANGLQIAIVLLAAAIWWAYEVPSTADTGQTVGKRVMRIKVVLVERDGHLGFGRSFRRWNTLGLPTMLWLCCIGFLLQLIDCLYVLFDRPLRQALHDKSAQTVVVALPVAPVPADATDVGGGGSAVESGGGEDHHPTTPGRSA